MAVPSVDVEGQGVPLLRIKGEPGGRLHIRSDILSVLVIPLEVYDEHTLPLVSFPYDIENEKETILRVLVISIASPMP